MEEKIKFVWEGSRRVYFYKAEKLGTWSAMEKRAKDIKESIEKAEEIRDLVKKALEFGVLDTSAQYRYYFSIEKYTVDAVFLANADLEFEITLSEKVKNEVEKKITSDPLSLLDEFIGNLRLEYEKHKKFMRDAERYLTVEIS